MKKFPQCAPSAIYNSIEKADIPWKLWIAVGTLWGFSEKGGF